MDITFSFIAGLVFCLLCDRGVSAIQWESTILLNESLTNAFLEVSVESSTRQALIQGGDTINYNVAIFYRKENSNDNAASSYGNYCEYVKEMENTTLYYGGESFLNCTNITRTISSNYTCNSSDGVNCIHNLTGNSTFFGNSSVNYTLLFKQFEDNVTSVHCVNVTSPLVPYKPNIRPASDFNLTYDDFQIEIELPPEFNIEQIEDLTLSTIFNNVKTDCKEYIVNSSYIQDSSKPKIMFLLHFGSVVSWNGSVSISALVTERVVPLQLLNVTGNVVHSGSIELFYIGSYTIPELSFKDMALGSTSFSGTPGILLTDEEEATVRLSFIFPGLTTDVEVTVELPVFGGSIPLKIMSARVASMQASIRSSNLVVGSGLGSKIVAEEVVALNPASRTKVKFKFGNTYNLPETVESTITLEIIGQVDSVGRSAGYQPNMFGNVTASMTYETAFGPKTIKNPHWVELELGQPQLKYEMSFVKSSTSVEGGDQIESQFRFFNPAFATEAVTVQLDVTFDDPHMELTELSISVCNVSLDSTFSLDCQSASLWPLLVVTNLTSIVNIQFTNLTSGLGLHGKAVSTVLKTIPASERLHSSATVQYDRLRWLTVSDAASVTVYAKPITVESNIISTSVSTTSDTTAAIGEKITFLITVTIPITTNKDFAIIANGGANIIYEEAHVQSVGSNLVGRGLTQATELNKTTGYIPEAGKSFSNDIIVGQFGVLLNTGASSDAVAKTISLRLSILVPDIAGNNNGGNIIVSSAVYHDPNRSYKKQKSLNIVEPSITASVSAEPDVNVAQDSEVTFTATVQHTDPSTAAAFNVLLQISVASPYLTFVEFLSSAGSLRNVPASDAPQLFLSPVDSSSVVIYEEDVFLHTSNPVEIKFKARTSPTLPAAQLVHTSIVYHYTSLPKQLNQSLARSYSGGAGDQAEFLTFRPEPFVTFAFASQNEGLFDSGDVLNFTIHIKNTGSGNVQPMAYTLDMELPLSDTIFKDTAVVCNSGVSPTITTNTIKINKTNFAFNEEISCDITTTLDIVVPSQKIDLESEVIYHCLPPDLQHRYKRYKMQDSVSTINIKPLSMELSAIGSTSQVLTGDTLEFNVRLVLPEVTIQPLALTYEIPTIDNDARGKRSLNRAKRAVQINVLAPQPTLTSYTAGTNIVVTTMTTSQSTNKFIVRLASVSNNADNVETSQDVLTIKATFQVVNQPVILSGRLFDISCTVTWTGGSASATTSFMIVGPLVKPLLEIRKSFQVLDTDQDSPSGIFYVNITHNSLSLYDAYDVNITDTTKGMTIIRDNEFPGIMVSMPSLNTHQFFSTIPVITVGQTVHFYYKSQFNLDIKTPKYVQTAAKMTWKSAQLNSPVYGPELNADACVSRNDTIKERDEPLYGFLALGAFLGLLIGFLLIIIAVCIFIKCCRRGSLVPYYRIFTGKTTYAALQEDDDEDKPYNLNTSPSMQQTESIVYIISVEDGKETEEHLEKLDMEATIALDRHLEAKRQAMLLRNYDLVVNKLRKKRDISDEKSRLYLSKMTDRLAHVRKKNERKYDRRTSELVEKMKDKQKREIKQLNEKMLKEIEDGKRKLETADKRQTKGILQMITAHYQTLENDVERRVQTEYDVEHERIRKEISVANRVSSKEIQTSLVKELAAESQLSEEDAQALLADHFQAIAEVQKIHDDERSRQVMTLEIRLEERRAIAQEMREQQQQEGELLESMKKKYNDVLENLVNSSQISDSEAKALREKLLRDVEVLNDKLDKQRLKQERSLHDRLTIMKQRKLQEKQEAHQLEIKKLDESSDGYERSKDLMDAYEKLSERHGEELDTLEREIDQNAAEELKTLRTQLSELARKMYKSKIEKHYRDLIRKGLLQDDISDLLNSHDQDVARIVEVQQQQQTKQKQELKEKLEKRRELLNEKMKAEQKQQEQVRTEEDKILKNMIDNQIVISEAQKEQILKEHEKNMAELESSLTLSKLRQKQMLQQKLAERKAAKMDKLQQKHINEKKRIKIENVDGSTDVGELLRKQEIEKRKLMNDDSNLENETEQIREDMLRERMEALGEHNDRLGALITELQIQRANQIAEINKQQRALGYLQKGILDDLDEKGVLVDPETKEILQQHQEQNQQLESALQKQREQQTDALKERLREKLKQKENSLIQEQKDEIAKYVEGMEQNSGLTRFRKTALKARHKWQLDTARQEIEREIEQSLNEMKLHQEVDRLKAIEKQSIQFIAALVKCGRIQEQELDSVLQVLFPTKKPEEIDELLTQIYGPVHARSSALSVNSAKPSSLEMKVIAQISPIPSGMRNRKARFEKPADLDQLPHPEAAENLAPVILPGSKGFNLQNSLTDSNRASGRVPLGKVRLAPLEK